jgi:hypothetical protein
MSNVNALNTDVSAVVSGPGSSTNNAIAIFNGTTGQLIQNTAFTISSNILNGNEVTAGTIESTTAFISQTSATFQGAIKFTTTSVTAASYSILTTDSHISVNYAGSVSLALPNVVNLQQIVIKDASGAAASNNITISRGGSALIDGQSSIVINSNYGSYTLFSDGTNWWII